MNERKIVAVVVAALIAIGLVAAANTDVIYTAVTVLAFGVCIAYAEGCERL